MKCPFVSRSKNKSPVLVFFIISVTVGILILNGYGLSIGQTTVLPHLFYIPIILTAYFFPHRGVLFACVISLIYCSMMFIINPGIPNELPSALGRVVVFIIVGAVVSFLTTRLNESEQKFRGVAERSSDFILLTNTKGRATYVSPSFGKILNMDPSEIAGRLPQDFIHPDDIGKLHASIVDLVDGKTSVDVTVRTRKKNGEYILIEYLGAPIITNGSFAGLQIIGRDMTERQRILDALTESEEKYRLLADYTYDWEYWITPDEKILYTTPSCERITGYSQQEFLSDKDLIRKIIHPEDIHALDHHMDVTLTRRQPCSADFRIMHRNGDIRWIGHVCQPIYDSRGEFTGRRASNRDITARKRIEYEFRDTNRRLADIVDFLPDPTMVIDVDGKVVAWNRAMEELTGIAAAVIIGKGDYAYATWFYGESRPVLIDMVLHTDMDAIEAAYPKYHRDGQTIRAEVETERPDGRRIQFWLTATPLFNQNGETVGAIESLHDVTHQKTIARAWHESKKYLDAIINTISDPVFVKDRKHQFVTLNEGFCHFIGHEREELLGKSDYDFFPKDEADIFWKKDEEVFSTGKINENEEDFTDASGTKHIIVTKKSLYINNTGEEFIVGIIRDITGRKRTEIALTEANKKLNLLSSITRHDINNQLFSAKAFLELSKESLDDTAQVAEYMIKIERALNAIERQIAFTREYQDLGVKAPVWQSLETCVQKSKGSLPMRDIRVIADVKGLEVYADPLFQTVFYNLIDNALRYGGSEMTTIRIFSQESDRGLVIVVEDDGTGISAEDRKHLFERGFGKHTGLGLFLSREILAITGIPITETGESGKGARFEIAVPKGAWQSAGTS
jgi:PAS domain S-box-containing protein